MARKSSLTTKRPPQSRRSKQQQEEIEDYTLPQKPIRSSGPIEPKTENQRKYINAIRTFPLTFGIGPAGTGKSYVAAALAAELLEAGKIDKIVITRPAVEAGESLGFLPGELEEKYEPYIQPFRDALNERLGKSHVDNLIKRGVIEGSPLAYMRGKTFKYAMVILDEAQNVSPEQMKMFLTRIGENAIFVVNGDSEQVDIRGESGLTHAIKTLSWLPSVRVVRFTDEDIVRSGLCGEIVQAYRQHAMKHLGLKGSVVEDN